MGWSKTCVFCGYNNFFIDSRQICNNCGRDLSKSPDGSKFQIEENEWAIIQELEKLVGSEVEDAERLELLVDDDESGFRLVADGAHVIGLDVHGYQLQSLPDTLGKLTKLKRLDISQIELEVLPESFGELSQLVDLNLSGNQFTSLPLVICKLVLLKELNLEDNELTSLPESIGQLGALKELNLTGNKLAWIPDTIGNLQSLETLVLMENPLKKLPPSLLLMKSLKKIWIDKRLATDEVTKQLLKQNVTVKLM